MVFHFNRIFPMPDGTITFGPVDHIGLKPILVVSKKASSGATTHPEFCEGIITFLQGKGFQNISILSGDGIFV